MTTKSRFIATLLGGAIGDALGYSVEFHSLGQIKSKYGKNGITDLELDQRTKKALISDDTQMTLFTADGLLWAYHRMIYRGIGSYAGSGTHHSYMRWYYTQTGSWPDTWRHGEFALQEQPHEKEFTHTSLLQYKELFARRAPGLTCLSALESGEMGTIERPLNNSKGCGGVMRVAPVGLFLYENSKEAFFVAAELAAITHGHATGYLAAGALAVIVAELIQGKSLPDAIETALTILKEYPGYEETLEAIELAVQLAKGELTPEQAILQLGEGWIAEEALAIALYCALIEPDVKKALILAVNHDGDSDSTGAICGNILGALHGLDALPSEWIDKIELKDLIVTLSEALFETKRVEPQIY